MLMLGACSEAPKANPKIPSWAEVAPGATFDTESGLPRSVVHRATGIVLTLVPAGRYVRSDEEGVRKTVTIPRPFYMAIYETTEAQWLSVMKKLPFVMEEDLNSTEGLGKDYPVRDVYWDEVTAFLRRTGFRFPTDAEWEHALRLGHREEDRIDDIAWHIDNTDRFMPVGQKRPNKLGIFDMLGNVCEWCSDRFVETRFPVDPDEQGEQRVVRGGSIWSGSGYMRPPDERSGLRTDPSSKMDISNYWEGFQGFRVCRDP